MQEWDIGQKHESTVSDWRKLIVDFRDQFPYDAVTALIVETFANSLDAGSTEVQIKVSQNSFHIIDNGKGMTQNQFVQYHNIASLTKKKGEGIGFAGVGAKTFIDRAEHIITETKSKNFSGASFWKFKEGCLVPEWESIKTKKRISSETGTYVEVAFGEKDDKEKLSPIFVKMVLKQYYNSVLLGYYKLKNVTVNNDVVNGWQPKESDIEVKKDFEVKYGKHAVTGFLIKTKSNVPEFFQGPSVVVFGKNVTTEWFKQYPTCGEKLTGIIFADYLIDILRTSKSDFDRTHMNWKYFHNRVGAFIGAWLNEIGAKEQSVNISHDLRAVSEIVESTVNRLLKLPEFNEIADKLFQNILKRQTDIKTKSGELLGTMVDGAQKVSGTFGGSSGGGGVDTSGDGSGLGVKEDEQGDTPIQRVARRLKGGIKISFENKSDNLSEGWIDPSIPAVIVNQGHPSWVVAGQFDAQIYHLLRTVLSALVEEVDTKDSKKIISEMLSKLSEV